MLVAAVLGAQEGGGLLNVGDYSKLFLNAGGRVNPKYYRPVSEGDYIEVAKLGGDNTAVDTPLEIAILSSCAGAIDVRPAEAVTMLGNAKQADLKLGAAVYQEMQVLRFLGDTAAVGRHEGILQFITGRGNISRAEIEAYYRQNIGTFIAAVVDAEVLPYAEKKPNEYVYIVNIALPISDFYLSPNQEMFNVLKGLNAYFNDANQLYSTINYSISTAEFYEENGRNAEAAAMRGNVQAARQKLKELCTALGVSQDTELDVSKAVFDKVIEALSPALATRLREESRR
jgi:hypothetical protein